MSTTIDNVHHRNRKYVGVSATNVAIERHIQSFGSRLSHSQAHAQNGVSTQVALRRRTVEVEHLIVDGALIEHIVATKRGSNNVIDILNSFQNALATITSLVAIAKFECFVFTCRSTRRNAGATHYTVFECYFYLYCGVTS